MNAAAAPAMGREEVLGEQDPPREGDAAHPAWGTAGGRGCPVLCLAYSPCDGFTGQDTWQEK